MKPTHAIRQAALVRLMKAGGARVRHARVGRVEVEVGPGVCHPAPFGGVSFAPLFEAALEDLGPTEHVLELGTGSGIWALLATQAGAKVTATDLPHLNLASVERSATRSGVPVPRLLHGDLFEPVSGERFDRVLFNPPFHFGEPADEAEQAYLGGPDGEVVRRFLRELPEHRQPGGRGFMIVPKVERAGYERELSAHRVRERRSVWLPVLGRVYLLELG